MPEARASAGFSSAAPHAQPEAGALEQQLAADHHKDSDNDDGDAPTRLRRVSELDQPLRWPAGRGDGARQTGGPDPRERQGLTRKPRDIYVPDLRIETLKVRARDFR